MILVASSSAAALKCVAAITKMTGEKVVLAADSRELATFLREREFNVAVIDQVFADLNPKVAQMIRMHAKGAVAIYPNFALASAERIAADVRIAIERRDRDRASAMRHASESLRSELNDSITGILLSSELALAEPELPKGLRTKLESVHSLAVQLRERLSAH